jgi:ADP-ribosylglycohydrolase
MQGLQDLEDNAIWTDDTEMTIAVTNALLRMGSPANTRDILQSVPIIFAEEFIKWYEHPGIAPGLTCTSAVRYLKQHGPQSWKESGRNGSRGCGAVMRVAPVGLWFVDDDELRDALAIIQAEITHGYATASSRGGALAVSMALRGFSPKDILEQCVSIPADEHFRGSMKRLQEALTTEFSMDVKAMHHIGEGWVGDEALAMALYAVVKYPNDFKKCMQISVNHDGDSDSVACIAGAILGAMHGMSIIPQDWMNKLAERDRLESVISEVIMTIAARE